MCLYLGAFFALGKLNQINLEAHFSQLFKLAFTPTNLIYVFSAFTLGLTLLKRFVFFLKSEPEQKQPMWDTDLGLVLGTVLLSSLLFASDRNRKHLLK